MHHDAGQAEDGLRHAPGKEAAVDREGAPRRHPNLVRHPHHERAETPHLFLEQARRLVDGVAAEAVRADELGEVAGLMHGCLAHGPHLEEIDGDPAARELPGGLAPGEAAADDGDAGGHPRQYSRRF